MRGRVREGATFWHEAMHSEHDTNDAHASTAGDASVFNSMFFPLASFALFARDPFFSAATASMSLGLETRD